GALQNRGADPARITQERLAEVVVRRWGGEAVPAGCGEDQVRLALRLREMGQPALHLAVLGDPECPLLEAGGVARCVDGERAIRLLHVTEHPHPGSQARPPGTPSPAAA